MQGLHGSKGSLSGSIAGFASLGRLMGCFAGDFIDPTVG